MPRLDFYGEARPCTSASTGAGGVVSPTTRPAAVISLSWRCRMGRQRQQPACSAPLCYQLPKMPFRNRVPRVSHYRCRMPRCKKHDFAVPTYFDISLSSPGPIRCMRAPSRRILSKFSLFRRQKRLDKCSHLGVSCKPLVGALAAHLIFLLASRFTMISRFTIFDAAMPRWRFSYARFTAIHLLLAALLQAACGQQRRQ